MLTAAAALAAPGDPKIDIKPADQKRATTIIAKKAELKGPGWQGAPTDFGRANPKCVIKHYSLGKLTANARVGTEYTRDVDTGTFLVDSDAYVFRTPAEAAFATSRVSDLGYGRCLAQLLVAEAPNGSVATSKTERFAMKGLALPGKGFRIVVTVITGGQTSHLTAHVLGFQHGRTLSSLSVLTLDKGWPDSALQSLAGKVAARTAQS